MYTRWYVKAARRQVWRTLFILDRFISAALGRPPAIVEEDGSEDALEPPSMLPAADGVPPLASPPVPEGQAEFDDAVQVSRVTGVILKKFYAKRKVSAKVGQDIINDSKPRLLALQTFIERRLDANTVGQPGAGGGGSGGIAALHTNLLFLHCVILFSRPFFIYMFRLIEGRKKKLPRKVVDRWARECVMASYNTVRLIEQVYDTGILPHTNPFIV